MTNNTENKTDTENSTPQAKNGAEKIAAGVIAVCFVLASLLSFDDNKSASETNKTNNKITVEQPKKMSDDEIDALIKKANSLSNAELIELANKNLKNQSVCGCFSSSFDWRSFSTPKINLLLDSSRPGFCPTSCEGLSFANGFVIHINLSNKELEKQWDTYAGQKINIKINSSIYDGAGPETHNPKFIGYAD